ncbi:MAG: hypothetical protein AUK47_00495 [Deltaproteobacteria bacterium CG2_30_63_29]|nr:MAG: hypothetical protein AUK47_00495 [Deltaproteobacteria bacterium CG2_30_63_29]PJB41790.1 MAG: hypothetical protein CO108_12560 [Deltaproteobacteria bacterium CG_4_9_14_3_um_filter_63_12]
MGKVWPTGKTLAATLCLGFSLGMTTAIADAQEPFGKNLEIFRGPIIGPANVVGMGGANIGLAEGSGAQSLTPAAVANRSALNGGTWFDWDWSVDWLNVGLGDINTDIENNGRPGGGNREITLINAAINFLFGRFGVGMELQAHSFGVPCTDTVCTVGYTEYSSILGGLTLGYNFLDGALIVATELTIPSATFVFYSDKEKTKKTSQAQLNGAGLTFGALWKPAELPFRFGLTARARVPAELDPSSDVLSLPIPNEVVVPWQVGLGFAYSLGPRTLNPRPSFDDTETRFKDRFAVPMWREYWLIAVDLLLYGPSMNAAGVEAWLADEVQEAGKNLSLSARLGLESEFWPHVMRGRIGSYYEPSRFEDTAGRFHGTAGFDVRLFEFIYDWRFTAGIDVADAYLNTMLSIGFWN